MPLINGIFSIYVTHIASQSQQVAVTISYCYFLR